MYETNEKGKEFDLAESIYAQLPFFACRNILYEKEIQKDIQRYMYCTESNVPPYKGSYNDQPAIWIDTYFIIKKAFAKKENKVIKDGRREKNSNN